MILSIKNFETENARLITQQSFMDYLNEFELLGDGKLFSDRVNKILNTRIQVLALSDHLIGRAEQEANKFLDFLQVLSGE